ncbi:hypothetical protein JW905_03275 [bacterium]|nr:hypothetical protein [candidate division CSSED10-310 bacterium]
MTEGEPKRNRAWCWVYLAGGLLLVAAAVWGGRHVPEEDPQGKLPRAAEGQQKKRLKPPPDMKFSGKSGVFETWTRFDDQDAFFVDFRSAADVRRGAYFWDDGFSSYLMPTGVTIYGGVPFLLPKDGSILVLPTTQDPRLQRKPKVFQIRLGNPAVGAASAHILGMVAGWGGEIADQHGASAEISFTYQGAASQKHKLYCCDIWDHAHQRRDVEKNNRKVTVVNGIHIDILELPLQPDKVLASIVIRDTNPLDSPLFLGITLTRPHTGPDSAEDGEAGGADQPTPPIEDSPETETTE